MVNFITTSIKEDMKSAMTLPGAVLTECHKISLGKKGAIYPEITHNHQDRCGEKLKRFNLGSCHGNNLHSVPLFSARRELLLQETNFFVFSLVFLFCKQIQRCMKYSSFI